MKFSMMVTMLLVLLSCTEWRASDSGGSAQYEDLQYEFPSLVHTFECLDSDALLVQTGALHSLPLFRLLYEDAMQVPAKGIKLCDAFIRDCRNPEAILYHTFRMLGAPAGGHGPPLASTSPRSHTIPSSDNLDLVISELTNKIGFSFLKEGERSWKILPLEIRIRILETLYAMEEADLVLQQFIGPIMDVAEFEKGNGIKQMLTSLMEPWHNKQLINLSAITYIEKADLRKLSFASRLLATELSRLSRINSTEIPVAFKNCLISTNLGQIGIFGSGNDTIDGTFALLIDLGGDDLHTGNIASPVSFRNPISMIIDLAGDDTYDAQNGYLVNGCMGFGMLIDVAGKDLYQSENSGIASACYGTAMLYDMQGDDIYLSHSGFSQGVAHLGSGVLVDLEGDDEYCCNNSSQGYGGTMGTGLLMDLSGDDKYNYSHETPSFVQGASRGRWAEATDGHTLGGGLGIFIEGGGSDQYHANSFSQGAAYFMGTGLFFDLQGDDHYYAVSHSQGYGAHYSLSAFFEMSGDDRYNPGVDSLQITQILGSGRDLSVGWFIEEKGDDSYYFGNRSAGIGDLNGIGIMWDRRGSDTYTWYQNSLHPRSPSMGQTMKLTPGMRIGPRIINFPKGEQLGVFRDDHQSKRIIVPKK